jgi:uncharacterized protein (TIGR00369 family)
MTIAPNPQDYGIPGSFQHWSGDEAENFVGPFFFRVLEEGEIETAFRLRPEHCNSHLTLHGGLSMMFADYTLCVTAIEGGQEGVVTVSCNSEFLAPARAGDLLIGRGHVVRKTRSLVFVRSELMVGDQIILTSSAVLKRVTRRV